MWMKTVIPGIKPKRFMPCLPLIFPIFKPFQLITRFDKELHLHLFKFPLSKNELPRHDFISESLSYLCNSKRNFHPRSILDMSKVDKDTLCSFRPQIKI